MGITLAEAGSAGSSLRHAALFYRDAEEYLTAVGDFLRAGARAAERMLVAVPPGRVAGLSAALGGQCGHLTFADMTELGRNPARIMPAIQAFVGGCAGQHVRYVGEPIWPGRSADEIREATRHEAMVNQALAGAPATVLCPYDVAALPDPVVADARRTHPLLIVRGRPEASASYRPGSLPAGCDAPLPDPPPTAGSVRYDHSLREVRHLIARTARAAGLQRARVTDLVLAVSEVAANTLKHTRAGGSVHIWQTADEIVCQVHDTGQIADPLAGYHLPDRGRAGGHGLWVVNQVCDLVELRSGAAGTDVRLRMSLARSRLAGQAIP